MKEGSILGDNFDPKLREAMLKIEAICVEYDCGAHINLVSPTHGEFGFVLPKWQCLYEEAIDTGEVQIRLTAKKADGDFPKRAELTAHFLHSCREVCARSFAVVDHFIKEIEKKWNIQHEFNPTPRMKEVEH